MAEKNKTGEGFILGGPASKPRPGTLSPDPARGSPPEPRQERLRFAAGQELGRLVKWIRFMGFDACLVRKGRDGTVDRILLLEKSRRPPALHRGWRKVVLLSEIEHLEQIRELIRILHIQPSDLHPMTRCGACNRRLDECSPGEAKGQVPEHVLTVHSGFRRCPGCQRIYWPGTHYLRIVNIIEGFFDR